MSPDKYRLMWQITFTRGVKLILGQGPELFFFFFFFVKTLMYEKKVQFMLL